MSDIHFGSMSSRQLTIRPLCPWESRIWNNETGTFQWSLKNALSLRGVLRSILSRHNWDFWVGRFPGVNHRCYCSVGSCIDGRILIAGYGFCFWYSHYTGEIPCCCDEALEKLQNAETGE